MPRALQLFLHNAVVDHSPLQQIGFDPTSILEDGQSSLELPNALELLEAGVKKFLEDFDQVTGLNVIGMIQELQELFPSSGDVLATLIQTIQNFETGALGTFITDAIYDFTHNSILTGVETSVEDVVGWLRGALGGLLAPFIDNLDGTGSLLAEFFTDNGDGTGSFLSELGQEFLYGIIDNGDGTATPLATFLQNAGNFYGQLQNQVAKLQTLIDGGVAQLGGSGTNNPVEAFIELLSDVGGGAVTDLENAIISALDGVGSGVDAVIAALENFPATNIIGVTIENTVDWLTYNEQQIADAIYNFTHNSGSTGNDFSAATIVAWLQNALRGVIAPFIDNLDGTGSLLSGFTDNGDGTGAFLSGLGQAFDYAVIDNGDGTATSLATFLQNAGNFYGQLQGQIAKLQTLIDGGVAELGGGGSNNPVTAFIDLLSSAGAGLASAIISALGGSGTGTAGVTAALEAIPIEVIDGLSGYLTNLNGAGDYLGDLAISAVTDLEGYLANLESDGTYIGDIAGSLITGAESIAGSIIDATVSNTAAWLTYNEQQIADAIYDFTHHSATTGNGFTATTLVAWLQNAFRGVIAPFIDNLDGTGSLLADITDNGDGTGSFLSGLGQDFEYALIDNLDGTASSVATYLQNLGNYFGSHAALATKYQNLVDQGTQALGGSGTNNPLSAFINLLENFPGANLAGSVAGSLITGAESIAGSIINATVATTSSWITYNEQQIADAIYDFTHNASSTGNTITKSGLLSWLQQSLGGFLAPLIDNLDGTGSLLSGFTDNGDGTGAFTNALGSNPVYTLIDNLDGTATSVSTFLQNIGNYYGQYQSLLSWLQALPNANVQSILGNDSLGQDVSTFLDATAGGLGTSSATTYLNTALNSLASFLGWDVAGGTPSGTSVAGITNSNSTYINQRAITAPTYESVDPTVDSVFGISQLVGTSPTYVSVTPTQSVMGVIGTPDGGMKETICWYAESGPSGLNSLVLNVYQVNTSTGAFAFLFASPNLVDSAETSPTPIASGWNYWNIPTLDQFTAAQGDVYVVEMAVSGASYNIVGLPTHWLAANTGMSTYPQQMGFTRSGVAPIFGAAGVGGTSINTGGIATTTWSHTPAAGDDAAVAYVSGLKVGSTVSAPTAKYGSVSMTLSDSENLDGLAADGTAWVFTYEDPGGLPSGASTITVTWGATEPEAAIGCSMSFNSYGNGFGTAQVNDGSGTSLTQTVTTGTSTTLVANAFTIGNGTGAAPTFSAYNQTSEYNNEVSSGTSFGVALQIGYAPGSTSVAFSNTASGSHGWAALGIPVLGGMTAAANISSPTGASDVPWFGLGGSAVPAQFTPQLVSYTTPGVYTFNPTSVYPLATLVDIIAVGGGQSGGSGSDVLYRGEGGAAGVWGTTTVTLADLSSELTITVGAGGAAAVNNGGPVAGLSGESSAVAATGMSVLYGDGGDSLGASPGTNSNYEGASPGNITYDGQPYNGGAASGLIAPGNAPGGGGGGGGAPNSDTSTTSGPGAAGAVFLYFYT